MKKTRCTAPSTVAPALAWLLITVAPAAQAEAAAPHPGQRSVSLAAEGDARAARTLLATLSLPWGERAWFSVGGGPTRSGQDTVARRPQLLAAALGVVGTGWQASLHATHRADGRAYRQTDGRASVDWQGAAFDLGLDGSLRDARQQATVTAPDGQGGSRSTPVTQALKGGGLGLRAGVNLGDHTRFYAGYARYRYRIHTQQAGTTPGTNGMNGTNGPVGALLGNPALLASALSTRPSAVNRDEAALSRSLQFGATYRFEHVALTAETTRDQVQDLPGTTRTTLLKAAVALGPQWTLAPAIGRTRSDAHGGVNFAALSARYAW